MDRNIIIDQNNQKISIIINQMNFFVKNKFKELDFLKLIKMELLLEGSKINV